MPGGRSPAREVNSELQQAHARLCFAHDVLVACRCVLLSTFNILAQSQTERRDLPLSSFTRGQKWGERKDQRTFRLAVWIFWRATTPQMQPPNRSKPVRLREVVPRLLRGFFLQEVVTESVRVLPDGETVSIDGTHLGHNLPDSRGNRGRAKAHLQADLRKRADLFCCPCYWGFQSYLSMLLAWVYSFRAWTPCKSKGS